MIYSYDDLPMGIKFVLASDYSYVTPDIEYRPDRFIEQLQSSNVNEEIKMLQLNLLSPITFKTGQRLSFLPPLVKDKVLGG